MNPGHDLANERFFMKTISLIAICLASFSAFAAKSPKIDLNTVCRKVQSGRTQLDTAGFFTQCRSLDDPNSYVGIVRGYGSSMSRMSPPSLVGIEIKGNTCLYSSFEDLRENRGSAGNLIYTATQTSENGLLKGYYKLIVSGETSSFSVKFNDGTTDFERFECY